MNIQPQQGLILLLGGTGGVGSHIARQLIAAGYKVRLVVRAQKTAQEVLKDQLVYTESVFECDLFHETKLQKPKLEQNKEINSILDMAFEPNRRGEKVVGVINAIGVNLKSQDDSKLIEITVNELFLSLCKKHKVNNYVLISSCLVTRPFHFIAYILNTLARNALAHKVQAENLVRKSGLNYMIVRPTALVGDSSQNTKITNCSIDQGDRQNGRITRATVAKLVLDAIQDENIPKKVTFECFGNKDQQNQEYIKPQFSKLKADDESSIVKANHYLAKSFYNALFMLILAASGAALYRLWQ